MTREEAKDAVEITAEFHYDGVFSHTESNVYKLIDQIYNDHEAQLKAKDEEIHYLKTQMTGYSMMFDEPQDVKARSIVAMLFWEYVKCRSNYRYKEAINIENEDKHDNDLSFYASSMQEAKYCFIKAYKILKDTK